MRLAMTLFIAAAVSACDTTDPTPFVPTYDPDHIEPVATTEFCSLLARNTCAVLRPCCEASLFSFDETKCRTASRALCEARRERSMELGLTYDDFQAGRCVAGTAILMQACKIVTDDPIAADVAEACRQVWHGTKVVGEACEGKLPVECAPPALGTRVSCMFGSCRVQPLAGGGEPCNVVSGASCEAGLMCEGAPARCTALIHPLGSPCTPVSCSGDFCGDRCGDSAYCDGTASPLPVCRPLPGAGESCSDRGCMPPLRCDTDTGGVARCTDAKPLGAPCNDPKECSSRLCIGSLVKLCAPPPFGLPIADSAIAHTDPNAYLTRLAAGCAGVIPDGAGGLAPLLRFPTDI